MSLDLSRLCGVFYFHIVGCNPVPDYRTGNASLSRLLLLFFARRIFIKNIPDLRISKKSKLMNIYALLSNSLWFTAISFNNQAGHQSKTLHLMTGAA